MLPLFIGQKGLIFVFVFCIRKNVLDKVSFRNDLWVAGKNEVDGENTDFVKKSEWAWF